MVFCNIKPFWIHLGDLNILVVGANQELHAFKCYVCLKLFLGSMDFLLNMTMNTWEESCTKHTSNTNRPTYPQNKHQWKIACTHLFPLPPGGGGHNSMCCSKRMVGRTKHVTGVDANQVFSLVDGNQRHNQGIIHQDSICQLRLTHLDGMVQQCMNAKVDFTLEEIMPPD